MMEPQRFISYLSSLFRNRSKFWSIPNVLTIDFEKLRLRVLVLKTRKKKKNTEAQRPCGWRMNSRFNAE